MARALLKLLGSGENDGFPVVATVPSSGIVHWGWKPWDWDVRVMFCTSWRSLSMVAVVTPSPLNFTTPCSIEDGEAKAEEQPWSARSMALEGTPAAWRSDSMPWF